MHLTEEQQAVIEVEGNARVNAVAGSGKTTTLLHFAKARPQERILYLAFNRSVRQEASQKFSEAGLDHVDVQTAHSLAYREVFRHKRYQVVPGYKAHELAEILQLRKQGRNKQTVYTLTSHIRRLTQLFCAQTTRKVQDIDYLATLRDEKSRDFVKKHHSDIVHQTRLLLAKMNSGEIPIIHDFYLKKFQLSSPQLPYSYILFDEGQDASPVMLDVFLQQRGHKLIVGDMHQQIYGWRSAVNALSQVDFPTLHLSNSFRFTQEIADLAAHYISWKKHLDKEDCLSIFGKGTPQKRHSRATLARTNLMLLRKAIGLVENRSIKRLYFEGNLNSYTYGQEGASLYDVLNLYLGKKRRVRDKLIASMPSFEALQGHVDATEDYELGMMAEIVQEYESDIPKLLKKLKELHVADDQKLKADMVFSTVHKCKGMEYDEVFLEEDFTKESDLIDAAEDPTLTQLDFDRLEEEINLLYVAATRTKNILHLPEVLIPESDFSAANKNQIRILKSDKKSITFSKTHSLSKKSTPQNNKNKRWSYLEEKQLKAMVEEGISVKKIAAKMKRSPGAIYSRIKKLELYE